MRKLVHLFIGISLITSLSQCGKKSVQDHTVLQKEVQDWLDTYNITFQKYLAEAAEMQWKLNTYILEGDTVTSRKSEEAEEAMARFTGSKENIERARKYLVHKTHLKPIQVRQLEMVLYMAGNSPETAGDIVKERIKAETAQTNKLFGFSYKIGGKEVSTNEIDRILRESANLNERLKAWEASKEVGSGLKDGLADLQRLRNECVQALDYPDYFAYQASDYGYSSDELMQVCREMTEQVWPLYRELHTWARYELATKYKMPVPEMIPAHWLPNRWGQEWTDMITVEGVNLDDTLKSKSAEWIVKEAEKFYVSLGFEELPASFYEKSSLYPLPSDVDYKKNNHASAWHMDNDKDVRSLMSVEPNTNWWETTLHELGHIYYYITYSNPDVPIILRGGANRAYHEAMGSLMGLASMQKPFLQHLNLAPQHVQTNDTMLMLREALSYVVLIPWSAGVMTEFEYDLYARNLSKDEYNKRWWELVKQYQGIVPPKVRGEEYCDAATKTHINNDPAQYYDYAMSNILLFQFHLYISKNILNQSPTATNYYGNREVGDFLKKLMYPGASVNWEEHLQKTIGEGMNAQGMISYFDPLMQWLKEKNRERTHTLPEKPF
ncbi:MAG: M2 family metallopeptidase [Candidatus Competibacteraceae bacterium]|nr:M2 family metallopeptidase [Candidatus Competibacteraceae bacterium]